MKFGKLVDYKKGILFFKNHAENEARTLGFLKKPL